MYQDHEFDPITPEEQARREQDELIAQRVRSEVRRIQRGEADEQMRADEAREQAEEEQQQQAEAREKRKQDNTLWQLFSGNILLHKGLSEYYRYMLCIAGMFFLSIVVFFTSLHLDRRYSRLEQETQILRERSIRLQEQRYRHTTHSAIVERLNERGIELYDPLTPGEIIEN